MDTSLRDSVVMYSRHGHDRDCATAILSQAHTRSHPIDEMQVKHLLQIGYRAGVHAYAQARRVGRTDEQNQLIETVDVLTTDRPENTPGDVAAWIADIFTAGNRRARWRLAWKLIRR